jgi:hypothetical protein
VAACFIILAYQCAGIHSQAVVQYIIDAGDEFTQPHHIQFSSAPFLHAVEFVGITTWRHRHEPRVYINGGNCIEANRNAAIMVIMGFPVIIPQLLLLIRISKSALVKF